MTAARMLRNPLKAATFETVIGLLAVTGLRGSEAMALDGGDLDATAGLLTVRATKFRKSRQLPLQVTTLRALGDYQAVRDQLCPAPATSSLLVSTTGARLCQATVQPAFRHLLRQAGIGQGSSRPRATIHGLRHTFAVKTLLGWYRDGQDVQARMPVPVDLPRSRRPGRHVLVPDRHPRAARPGGRTPGGRDRGRTVTALAPVLQAFFTDRLIAQRQVSGHTVAAYRDTFRLLLAFAQARTGTAPCDLHLDDLDAGLIGAFLEHLRNDRHNGARTRNARLAAIHSLFRYAALRHPEHAALIQRVLAIPPARFDKTVVSYLTAGEAEALLAAPDRSRWTGRRDHALLAVAIQTGLRVSELTALTRADVHLGTGAHVRCTGKGRKERCTPLTAQVVRALRAWLGERGGGPGDPLFPTSRGQPLSRDAVELLVTRHATTAQAACPTLARQDRFAPCAAAHSGHVAAARRDRHHRDRALARPRALRNSPDLHPRRPDTQTAGPRPDHPFGHPPRPLPSVRQAARLPRAAELTAPGLCRGFHPSHHPRPACCPAARHNPGLGITAQAGQAPHLGQGPGARGAGQAGHPGHAFGHLRGARAGVAG